jgi:hypothetical protein
MKRTATLLWQEVHWTRPFSQDDVLELLSHLAVLSPRKQIVWEVRATAGKVRFFIGTHRRYLRPLKTAFMAHGDIAFSDVLYSDRIYVDSVRSIKRTKPMLSLGTDRMVPVLKTALSALADTKSGETLVVQIILGDSTAPTPAPDKSANPHATVLDTICGKIGNASRESLQSIKDKSTQHGFYASIRIGAKSKTANRELGLHLSMMSAFRQFEKAGVKLIFTKADSDSLNKAKIPFFLPLKLSVAELAGFVLLPCTNAELAGVDALHPKLLRPPVWWRNRTNSDRVFAESLEADPQKINISVKDSLEHTIILGPTGSGKSTVMQNLIMSDIEAGRGVLVVDPKTDLINEILARIPSKRADDVVVIDPSDIAPVGINPFTFMQNKSGGVGGSATEKSACRDNHANPALISDSILSVFQQVFKDSWGVYSQDVISASLLTLANAKNATLLHLPTLLTNDQIRHSITSKIKDKHLSAFWASFEAMSKSERQRTIAPVMNKLRQFTMRPALRNMLGQAQPKFNLCDLFNKNKIVLVQLNKGIIGAESAKLIGSLVVGLTWTLALSRANIPAEKRTPVSVFIDELQDYLALPGDFSDALAQARGLGVGFTVAHQYRSQLTPGIKSAIDSNARNKVIFGLNGNDSKDMSTMTVELEATDFIMLPRHHIYSNIQNNGKSTGWISGRTLPSSPPLRLPFEMRAYSQQRYGQELAETDTIVDTPTAKLTEIGRKKITK